MTKWIVAGALVAVAVLGGAPAAGAAADMKFTNVCGGVTVTTNAADGSDVRISRNGKPAGGFALSGGTFTVAAHHSLTIGVAIDGGPEVTHFHSDPDGCSNRNDLTATFDDWCFDRIYVRLRGSSSGTPAFIVTVNGAAFDVGYEFFGPVPDRALLAVYRDLPGGERGFYASHVYRTPTGCGASSLSARFTDHCYGVRAEVTSTASGWQSWSSSHSPVTNPAGGTRGNGTSAQQISPLAEGETFTLNHLTPPDTYTPFATHTYRKPAECASRWKTPVSFVDTCAGTAVTITSLADVREYWIDAGGKRREIYLTLGESKTVEVQGATAVVSAGGRLEGDPDRTVARHTYAMPAGCGGLPVTGAGTAAIAGSGVLIVLLGVATFVLARRRRVPR